MRTLLFDRFESERESGFTTLARDLADLLGARRAFPRPMPGILNWGLSGLSGLNPTSHQDRLRLAGQIEAAIEQFEPRLQHVRATPIEDTTDFAFELEATFIDAVEESISLRILAPLRGGGLGAEVIVLGRRARQDAP